MVNSGIRRIFNLLCVLLFAVTVAANKEKLNQKEYVVCSGMYSKSDFKGKVDPFISFNLKSFKSQFPDDTVVVAIYEFQDIEHLGVYESADSPMKTYICDDGAVERGLCDEDHLNEFIIVDTLYDPHSGENKTLTNTVMTFSQSELGLHDTKYPVTKTGFYCVAALPIYRGGTKYEAIINFRNSYGHLAGSEINKLPLYGLLAIGYGVAMALYSFAFWKHKHELLPLQKYILAFFVFLTIETIFTWAYYDICNQKGKTAGTAVYMVFVSIMSAGKATFSFFLLLIVALGYGIVYPKLNRALMRKCQFYALFTFALCVAFIIHSYTVDVEDPSPLLMITFIPFMISLLVFYFLIIRAMSKTTQYLREQRQVVKLNMYRNLLLIIWGSFITLLAGVILSSVLFLGMNTKELIEKDWRSRFLFTDFWPSMVYLIFFCIIAFIWRPTDTSYMLAVSQQLPTDPDNVADFDLGDLQSFEDDNEDLENHLADDISIITEEEVPTNFREEPENPKDPKDPIP
ncbi:Ptm1p [Nakaseomyces bracarensis]|uniref:Ptm1p n=1 Tax=Nakaseomyces bracarensis TaxID=273131 RepID=UPI003871C253